MTDVCTLITTIFTNAIVCLPTISCTTEPVDGKIFCQPHYSLNAVQLTCNKPPPPSYECKRADGSTYIWTEEAVR